MKITEKILINEADNQDGHAIHLYKKNNRWYTYGISAQQLNRLTPSVEKGKQLFADFEVILPYSSITEEDLLHMNRRYQIEYKLPDYKIIRV